MAVSAGDYLGDDAGCCHLAHHAARPAAALAQARAGSCRDDHRPVGDLRPAVLAGDHNDHPAFRPHCRLGGLFGILSAAAAPTLAGRFAVLWGVCGFALGKRRGQRDRATGGQGGALRGRRCGMVRQRIGRVWGSIRAIRPDRHHRRDPLWKRRARGQPRAPLRSSSRRRTGRAISPFGGSSHPQRRSRRCRDCGRAIGARRPGFGLGGRAVRCGADGGDVHALHRTARTLAGAGAGGGLALLER